MVSGSSAALSIEPRGSSDDNGTTSTTATVRSGPASDCVVAVSNDATAGEAALASNAVTLCGAASNAPYTSRCRMAFRATSASG